MHNVEAKNPPALSEVQVKHRTFSQNKSLREQNCDNTIMSYTVPAEVPEDKLVSFFQYVTMPQIFARSFEGFYQDNDLIFCLYLIQ